MWKPPLKSPKVLFPFIEEKSRGANKLGERGLERAVVGHGGSNNDSQVEEQTGSGETKDDPSDQVIDCEEVFGKGRTKEEEGALEHQGWTLHDELETPDGHTVHLALTVPAAVDEGSMRFDLRISVEPPFA